jgi:glycosyltransferase involved in cell wall biosynthesis
MGKRMEEKNKRPLHVLILTYIYTDGDPRYGGEGRVVWETTQALARAGVKVFVVTSMKNIKTTPHPNITVYKVPFAKKNFLNFNPGELLKIFLFAIPLIFLKRIDIIHHLPTNGPDPFARFKFGRVFVESADPSWGYDNPKFSTDLGLDRARKLNEAGYEGKLPFDLSTPIARRIWRWLGVAEMYPKGVDVFFYRTPSMRSMLSKLRPQSALYYVPNGVDVEKFSPHHKPLYEKPKQGIRFLHLGSINRRKGTNYLVKAFIASLTEHPENELFLAGRSDPEFVKELKELSKPHSQIRFLPPPTDEELPLLYVSADVFCLLLLGGPLLTVTAEAFASGLPVLATRGNGCGEAVAENDAGFLVEPGDIDNTARAIIHISENRQLLSTKASNALAAAKNFSWDYAAQTLIKGYTEALGYTNHNS